MESGRVKEEKVGVFIKGGAWLTGMEDVLCALFLCLFRVVVVGVDDLTEKSLLFFI